MNVAIDREACIGCGVCAELCHNVFGMGADNIAVVRYDPDSEHRSCAVTAVEDCPTDAIHLIQ